MTEMAVVAMAVTLVLWLVRPRKLSEAWFAAGGTKRCHEPGSRPRFVPPS